MRDDARTIPLLLVAALPTAGSGCLGSSETEFPAGLEPLDEVGAPWPGGDGEHPETLSTAHGSTDDYDWVHARGYVHAPLAEVYPALRVPEVNVNRRQVDEWSVTWDVEDGYDHSYALDLVVHDIITIEYRITWRHGLIEGTDDAPLLTAARYQKTDGTDVIRLKEGSVVATEVEDGLTGLELVERMDSLRSDHDTIESYLRDMYADLLAVAHGEPLPTYDE